MKIKSTIILTLAALLAVVLPARPAAAFRSVDPIQVPGDLLTALRGKPLDRLRLYALRNGALVMVPYQIDERLSNGTFIFELGSTNKTLANKKLDPIDLLVFRARDLGGRAGRELWPSPLGVEIELRDPRDSSRAYCYLFHFAGAPPARPAFDTIKLVNSNPFERGELPFTVSGETYTIEGMVNQIRGRFYKTAVNKSLFFPCPSGRTPNLLDGMRMRAYGEMLFGQVRIDADETNMMGGIQALTQGPIRGYGRQWMTFSLPLGISGPRIYSDVFTYDRVVVAPMKLSIPFNPEALLTRAGIEFGYDFSEFAVGMRFYSPNCLDGVTIDGKMSAREKALPNTWIPWYVVTGPTGSLIFRVQVDQRLLAQTKNQVTWIDDRARRFPPEKLPGCIGYNRTTIEMESVKAGDYPFRIEWYFPPDLYQPGGFNRAILQQYLEITDAPLVIQVGNKSVKNRSLSPPALAPEG